MTQLIFGDPECIKLAKQGEIPPEAEEAETTLIYNEGCNNPCEHCEAEEYWECENCGFTVSHPALAQIKDCSGKNRCKQCKYIIL